MLYSRQHSIAFAHYPKTAGHSMVKWFRATSNTRLLDLESLDDDLDDLTEAWGIKSPVPRLDRCNVGPRPVRDLSPYLDEAGALATAARSYFGWYYRRQAAAAATVRRAARRS